MICSHCGEAIGAEPAPETCPACEHDPLLDGRYRLDAVVGRGAAGITYRAERVGDGLAVAIKEMPFHRIDAQKTRELFEREARVLRQLDHDRIPRWRDDFVHGDGRHRSLYLVQDFIDGPTLAAELDTRRHSEADVLAIIADVADILTWLHDLRPPVIHRDIKPHNIMRRADGALVLVDFGAVRDAVTDRQLGGSTVVGTYGYMAPEQYRGDASPQTDLHALGVTAVVLLTRQTPDALTDHRGLDWRGRVALHPATEALIGDLLAPDPADRPESARATARRARAAIDALADDHTADHIEPAPRPAEPRRPTPAARPDGPLPRPFVGAHPDLPREAPRPRRPIPESHDHIALDTGERRAAGKLIAAVALLFAVPLVLSLIDRDPPRERPTVHAPASRCGDKECSPVPRGLKSLTFGMTVAEARAALPELDGVEPDPKPDHPDLEPLFDGLDPALAGMIQPPAVLPGPSYTVRTTLGALGAQCQLDFAAHDTLSRMSCEMEDFTTLAAHRAALETLRDALADRYGRPTDEDAPADRDLMGVEHHARYTWRDDRAELELASRYRQFALPGAEVRVPPTSDLTLTNTSAEHVEAQIAARRAADERAAAAAAERRRKAERDAREARERLDGLKDTLGDDL
ncbi:MAG: serine/threonine-protein kinase [bacterium]